MPPLPPDTAEPSVTACIIHLDYKAEQTACLTREEIDQGNRFCFEEDRQRHLASHAALRMILGEELGIAPSAVPIRSRHNGKPFLPDHQLHFNLSHSRRLALVAFSADCDLGVDVEFKRPLPDLEHLTRRNFAPPEIDWILSHPPPQRQNAFFKLWTCKEAWLKGIGTGIARGLDSFSVSFTSSGATLSVPTNPAEELAWSIHPLKIDIPNYAAAVSVQATSPALELKTWLPGPFTGSDSNVLGNSIPGSLEDTGSGRRRGVRDLLPGSGTPEPHQSSPAPPARISPGSKMMAFIFPGQGSQMAGMGEGLFQKYSHLVAEADEILGYDLEELCLKDPGNLLGQTQYTQPSLYAVSALTYLSTVDERGSPDYVAGHSLGEYAALFAARVFDFSTGMRLVQKRGALMSEASGGGMAAVVGMSVDKIKSVLEAGGRGGIEIANYNAPGQTVISGSAKEIQKAQKDFEAAGCMLYIVLNVSGAFHSWMMEPAQKEFTEFLKGFSFSPPEIPVISNVEAKPYSVDRISELLSQQITQSVQWDESVGYLLDQGVEEFHEVGPGNVLTGLVRKIKMERKENQ